MRGVKIAYGEPIAYYLPSPRPPVLLAIDIILFWVPLVLGTQTYTLTSFNWIAIVTALKSNKFIECVRLPLVLFFYLLVPFIVLLTILSVVFHFSTFLIFCALIMVAGIFEAFVFLFYGIKILKIMSVIQQVNTEASSLEKRVSRLCPFVGVPYFTSSLCRSWSS